MWLRFSKSAAAYNIDLAQSFYAQAIAGARSQITLATIDFRFVLGRNALEGRGGIPKNPSVARFWLQVAADRGSKPAQNLLNTLASHPLSQANNGRLTLRRPHPQAASS